MSPSQPSRPTAWWSNGRLRLFVHLVLAGVLIGNLFVFVLQNAVALPCSDQWDLHLAVWRDAPFWQLFRHQHGPHRQGIFFPLTSAVLHATNGDIRAESLMIASWLAVAALLGWTLPRRLTGRWSWADALPLLWCLSLLQYETITATPNLSHSIGPLVLVLAAAHALLFRNRWLRWATAATLASAAVFTGFGLFAGLVLLALAAWAVLRSKEERLPAALATGLLVMTWAWFFSGYVFSPAAPDFAFPHFPLWDYVPFLTAMASAPFGFGRATDIGRLVGAMVLLASALGLGLAALRLIRDNDGQPAPRITLFLLGSALLFMLNTAVGRVQLGPDAGMAPRYISLMVPMAVGLYLIVRTTTARATRWAGTAALASLALWPFRDIGASPSYGTWGMPRVSQANSIRLRDGKQAWIWLYRQSGDSERATRVSRFEPLPHRAEFLDERLSKLRALGWAPFGPDHRIRDFRPLFRSTPVVPVGFHGPENGVRWMGAEAFAVIVPRKAGWLNLDVRARAGGLAEESPLEIELAGRSYTLRFAPGACAVSLPLVGGSEQVLRLRSPRGATRPCDTGTSTDSRDLSFRIADPTMTDTPRFLALGPQGTDNWAPRTQIVDIEGFHGWEDGFGWMAAELVVHVAATESARLTVTVGNRFDQLRGPGGLGVQVDAGPLRPVTFADHGFTNVEIEVEAGAHTIRLRSDDGAISPGEAGIGDDPRPLSYSLHAITFEVAADNGAATR